MRKTNYLSSLEKKALSEFEEKLKKNFGNNKFEIILFGSKARGDSSEESDVDLLVLLKDVRNTKEARRKIKDVAGDISLKWGVLITNVVVTLREFKEKEDYSFFQRVRKEGVKV